MFRGPLARSYPGAVGLVAFSLIPYLALVVGVFPLSHTIAKSLGLSPAALDVTIALSTGAYAAGTVVAVQFAVHLPARRMLVLYEAIFVAASILSAWSPNGDVFMTAFVVQGFCTSLMLIAAVPPLVTSWPTEKMPVTGAIMNLCIFGAVAAGPTVGALQLASGGWRPLFWIVAALAVVALIFSVLTFQDDPPQDRSAPVDVVALVLALVGCGAAFFGAGELEATSTAGLKSLTPLIGGTVTILALVIYEYRLRNPLMPVRALITTVPVTGLFIALTTSAAAFGIMVLVLGVLQSKSTPADIALYFLPEFAGAIAVAGLFGALFRTRFTPVLALAGLVMVVASAALLLLIVPGTGPLLAVVAGLLGLGVAASVSPALFMAGFSLRSRLLQRVFAMIELMRAVTAFLVAPVLAFLAAVLSKNPATGTEDAVWICLVIAAVGFVGGCALYLSGRPRLETPDLQRWQRGEEPAWSSPPLLSALRSAGHDPAAMCGPGMGRWDQGTTGGAPRASDRSDG
jgi:MFS family permease